MLKKICVHWTGGGPKANRFERQFYHRLVEQSGVIVPGKFKPEANIPPLKRGFYAEHCGGGNSNAIGWALCGMGDFDSIQRPGDILLTRVQCESAWAGIARDCKEYRIPVLEDYVYTHYVFGKKNPRTTSRGKIDIIYLPFEPKLKADEIDPYVRDKVKWYLSKL